MYYLKHNGENLEIDHDNVYTLCAECSQEFDIDLAAVVMSDGTLDLTGTAVYCSDCHNRHRAAEDAIAKRYNAPVEQIQDIVSSGMSRGLTREAALVGARLGLSTVHGGNEYFTIEEAAEAIGGTVEDVKEAMEQGKINPATLRPAPGFEWLFM